MAKFYDKDEIVRSLCLRSGDLQYRNKGIYMEVFEDVFLDLNTDILKQKASLKIPIRQEFIVDKKTNSINIPHKSLMISSVNSVDRWGHYHPLYRNNSIPEGTVDLSAIPNCACENNCSSQLCNTIKGYEAVTTIKKDFLPDATPISFTCTDKKFTDNNGFFYSQTQYPLRVYLSGVWTNTILYTENKKLCELEIESNGCICDTDSNLQSVCNACGIDDSDYVFGGSSIAPPIYDTDATTWVYECGSQMNWFNTQCGGYAYGCQNEFNNIYNISQAGDRIIFPANFGWDKVMVRFYEDIDIKNIQIPYLAKECFMTGLQAFSYTNNDKKQKLATFYEQKYGRQKWGLLLTLNKYRIAELKEIFTPKAFMPSYINNPYYGRTY